MKSFKDLMKETFTDKDFERVIGKKKIPFKGQIRGEIEKYVGALEQALMAAGSTSKLNVKDLDDMMTKAISGDSEDLPTADPKDVQDAPGSQDDDVSGLFAKGPTSPASPPPSGDKMPSLKKAVTGKPSDGERFHSLAKRTGEPDKPQSPPGTPEKDGPEPKFLTTPSQKDVSGPDKPDWKALASPIRGTEPPPPELPNPKPGSQAALKGKAKFDTGLMKRLKKSLAGKPQMSKEKGIKMDKGSPYLDPKAAKRADKKGFLPSLKKLTGK